MNHSMASNQPVANFRQTTTFHYLILVLLIILASIERIYGIDRQSLWSDELFAVMISYKHQFSNIWPLLINDSHPPGYVALMYWITPLLGYSDVGIRLHALIYGILWIPLVFWIGKRWFSNETGLLAATFIASAYSAIYFSQEARAYSMLVAFSLGNLICFLEILFATKARRGHIYGFIISSALILYLHYTCFVFFAAEILLYIILHVTSIRKGSLHEMIKLFGIPLLLFSPWMGLMFNHLTDTSRNWAVTAKPTMTDVRHAFLYLWGSNHYLLKACLYSLAIAISWAGYSHFKNGVSRQSNVIYTLVFLLVVPVLAFYVESIIWTPIFEKRYFIITLPLVTLLMAEIISRTLKYLVSTPWLPLALLLVIILITTLRIHSNINQQLYTRLDKEPVREAIDVIAQDINAQTTTGNYTVLMSHPWFGHYLKQARIPVTARFTYDMADQLGRIDTFLNLNSDITYFYYLSFNAHAQPRSEAAIVALTQQYKLLSKATTPFLTGNIDIFKFSTQMASDSNGPNNAAGRFMAQEVRQKKPNSYAILMTHNWVEPQLTRNGVHFDKAWPNRLFELDIQIEPVSAYLHDHPAIDTLYYLARRDPNNESGLEMLTLQYQLLSKNTVESSIGLMDIYKFNTRLTPGVTSKLKEQMKDNPVNKATALVEKYIKNANPNSYAIAMTHSWFQPYLRLRGLRVDDSWEGRIHGADFQSEGVFTYVNQHPEINNLYYLALRDGNAENGLLPLLLKYQLLSYNTVEAPVGKLEVFHFKTAGKKFSNPDTFDAEFSKSPAYIAASSIAKQIGSAKPDRYVVLTSHQWFNLYLRKLGLDVDRAWPGHLLNEDTQVEEVFNYVRAHPTISDLHYMAYREANNDRAAARLQSRYRLLSKNSVKTALGQIDVYRFDTKTAPK